MTVEATPVVSRDRLLTLAEGFPSGLNTADPATDLDANETPDAVGLDLSKDGRLAKGSAPTGVARNIAQRTVNSVTYEWHHRRLWRINSTDLEYGAYDYDDKFLKQGISKIPALHDSTTAILQFVPFGSDMMCVSTEEGSSVVSNVADTRAIMPVSNFIEELKISAAGAITELDGVVYASNADGIFSFNGQQVQEVTRKVRNDLTPFASQNLYYQSGDIEKKYILSGSATNAVVGVYEVPTQKLFEYSGSTFRWTSRQFHLPNYDTFQPQALRFVVEHNNTDNGYLTYQVRYDDDEWSAENTTNLPYTSELYTIVREDIPNGGQSCRRFQLRINDIDVNKYIKKIVFDPRDFNLDDYGV